MFVPEHQAVDELLREMQKEKQKLAIAVDEYGGFSGMVAVEDIIEEVLGDLRDEIDDETTHPEIKHLGKGGYLVEASTNLDDIAAELNIKFPEERDYDSIGGLVYFALGTIPEPGEKIEYDTYHIEVIAVEKNRIEKVKLTLTDES
jgi:putative hemolysin